MMLATVIAFGTMSVTAFAEETDDMQAASQEDRGDDAGVITYVAAADVTRSTSVSSTM